MGLLLSVLVGCVGVLELLTCLRHTSDGLVITINPPTPCLSYHEPAAKDVQSVHDSICSFSHSPKLRLPRAARHKLENLHEYSLRVRNELRTLDKNFDYGTLSEYSAGYLLGSRSDSRLSPESRLSPDFRPSPDSRYSPDDLNYFVQEDETWIVHVERHRDEEHEAHDYENEYIETKNSLKELNAELRESLRQVARSLIPPEPEKYVRIPTPIPLDLEIEMVHRRASSSEVDTSFDKDSGNEAPTMRSFEGLPIVKKYKDSRSASSVDESDHEERRVMRKVLRRSPSRSQEPLRKLKGAGILKKTERPVDDPPRIVDSTATEVGIDSSKKTFVSQRKPKSGKSSTTIVRKPTRLKSRNAEVSRSAENLSTRATSKRNRDPERRKSDISVQTMHDLLKDTSTNTSPISSPPLSRSDSKKSVSVEVQTTLEDALLDDEAAEELGYSVLGLSESKKDLFSRDNSAKKSFKSKRFRSSSRDEQERQANVVSSSSTGISWKDSILSERRSKESNGWRRPEDSRSKSSFEENDDDEFADAEDLIFSGEYTKAMNKDWHSGHFCCWQCDESLTGQRYVLRDEHPYCIKCYESVFANGCEECNKIIGIDSKDLSYKDKHWHEACFLCNRCRVSLVDKQFGSKVDKIYCGNCYDAQFASRCDGCGEIFRAGTKKMEYKTRQWHEKCFCCVVCKNPIGTKSFIPREQEIYCAGCYEDKFATRCVKCNKIITSGGVTYKNEPWHRDCFTCSNCNNSLAGQRFTSRDDKPYCADCFGELFAKRCTACSKPITGIGGTRFISFEDRHWHNDCFICAGCKTSLVGRGFITDGDDIICPECAKMKLM
ncbi:PREDICTED: uncharacterized protein LOC106740603 isoform X4 [Dinoponera quadriceps]|uniref:Uncharacterized protein LOC106740603 isoform X4 n=1 Tax=Dinoponera quadriceps TaxID=609295 RepID=A0A6P3WMG9_DINQU|nr:PREDICTED: uncharacterized protein LOC106740603 isoform X4 [Dinoponera quadriceps]